MTRGKHAARAANGRTEALATEVESLKSQLAQARMEHQTERAALKAEVQQLKNRLTREVDDLSREQITRAQKSANEQVEKLIDRHRQQCGRALKVLCDDAADLPMKTVLDVADAFGVNLPQVAPDIAPDAPDNRTARRRNTNKQLRFLLSVMEDSRRAGRPGVEWSS